MDSRASDSPPGSAAPHAYDAFVSYATEDRRIASKVQIFLQLFRNADGRRLHVYLDETHIRGGDLTQELSTALRSSSALIVVCSNAGAASLWVRREIDVFLSGDRPRVALVLAADDLSTAIPAALQSSEIRFHDLRRGLIAGIWKPAARNELLRLVAWLTDANLSTLINWERRRLLKRSVAGLGALLLPVAAVYNYAARRRPIEPADIQVEIVLSWIYVDASADGATIDDAMLNSPTLILDILPSSHPSSPLLWTWPTNARRSAGMQGKVMRLTGRLDGHDLRSFPSVDGTSYESRRRFSVDATSLGALSGIDEWEGATVAVAYSALGLGASRPALQSVTEAEHDKELAADAKHFYGIDEAQWRDLDYSIRGVPVRAALTISLRNQTVGRAQAAGLRVWEYDEDVRDLHVLIFKPFRLT